MKKLIFISVFFIFNFVVISQNSEIMFKPRPADYEYLSAPDSLGVRHQLLMPKLSTNNKKATAIATKLPYPIIFIHGLDSDASVWGSEGDTNDMHYVLTSFGLTFGGRFDFNLNDDNDNLTSNKIFYPNEGSDIAQYYSTVVNGDFYFLNFAIGSDGSYNPSNISSLNVLSNEAAIAKQGVALSRAIQQVMNITGRDKVVLFGHSMGGLCAREYLQNPENWTEPNINHHVAKLITTGTPHGGYTGTNSFITGKNSSSEAYRDLRTEYSNNNAGAFLFGGTESSSYIGTSYYNNDVNCNGTNNDGTIIKGLNKKELPTNEVDFAYIMGNCNGCPIQGLIPGDGIVRLTNANLSNFTENRLPSPKNEFIYTAFSLTEIHSDLPKAITVNMQGLDEPNEYNLAYEVNLNQEYKGFITEQPVGGYSKDFDDYKFNMPTNGDFNITVSNTFSGDLFFNVLDNELNIITTNTVSGNSTNQFSQSLNNGIYFLEFFATPTSTSYQYPYTFSIQNTLSVHTNLIDNYLAIYPNPTNSKVNFNNTNTNFESLEVYNLLGQKMLSTKLNNTKQEYADISNFENGIYLFKFTKQGVAKTFKVVKN